MRQGTAARLLRGAALVAGLFAAWGLATSGADASGEVPSVFIPGRRAAPNPEPTFAHAKRDDQTTAAAGGFRVLASGKPRNDGRRAEPAIVVATEIPPAERRSDSVLLAPETRAMQADDPANPAMLSVLDGEELWSRPEGLSGASCATCHGAARDSMAGAAARHPVWSEALGRPVDLAGHINLCRERRQGADPLARESPALLALSGYVAHQSRGMPIVPSADPRLEPARERGRTLFERRMGQLDLSCAQCHDDNWGRRLAGSTIPQAHPVGYPIYRLEWQAVGSLQRRFRGCMAGIRAEPYPYGAAEYVELELYLMTRAGGLLIETPAVRP